MLSEFDLPYFHMAECNVGTGIYSHLDSMQCDRAAREAIRIAREYPLHGHSFVLDQIDYRRILQDHGFGCDPYTFMVWNAFIHVNRWTHENRPNENISLFFESGYRTQFRANQLLQQIIQDEWGGKNRVTSFSFVGKEYSEPIQAADLISWHVRKGYENARQGRPIRRDTLALMKDRRVLTITYTDKLLEHVAFELRKVAGSLEKAEKMLFAEKLFVPIK